MLGLLLSLLSRTFELTSERGVLLAHRVRQLYNRRFETGLVLNCYGAEMVRPRLPDL